MAEMDRNLVKLIYLVGKGARLSLKPLLILIWGCSFITLMSVVYVRWAMEENWWWSFSPLFLMLLPLIVLVVYWFGLDGISKLPETLLESKALLAELKRRYAQRRIGKEDIKGLGPIATVRRMLLLGGLLWDSRNVIDTASNLYGVIGLFSPVFWIIMFISLISSIVFCGIYVLVCAGHYFFVG